MAAKKQQKSAGGEANQVKTPVATLSDAAVTEQAQQSVVDELRGEVMALRRELRLLRIANAELERVAVRDPLTPLYNRRYFLTALNERLARARRYNSRAAVLFIDINRMKYINDVFGHSAGDFALIHAAQLVQANIRTSDVAARIGGDEFALIIEEASKVQAEAKAQELENLLRSTECVFGTDILPVSASIGLTMLQPGDTEDALIERADANMYLRKRAWHRALAVHNDSDDSAVA
ncbi:MAG: GGDEF domain-containing protein [Sphingobium sp.]